MGCTGQWKRSRGAQWAACFELVGSHVRFESGSGVFWPTVRPSSRVTRQTERAAGRGGETTKSINPFSPCLHCFSACSAKVHKCTKSALDALHALYAPFTAPPTPPGPQHLVRDAGRRMPCDGRRTHARPCLAPRAARLAQTVEHSAFNRRVLGSSPKSGVFIFDFFSHISYTCCTTPVARHARRAAVAERLRRLTRNQFPTGSVGSIPTGCASLFTYFPPPSIIPPPPCSRRYRASAAVVMSRPVSGLSRQMAPRGAPAGPRRPGQTPVDPSTSWPPTRRASYLPGTGANRDHEGGSPRARLRHCTSARLTSASISNADTSGV